MSSCLFNACSLIHIQFLLVLICTDWFRKRGRLVLMFIWTGSSYCHGVLGKAIKSKGRSDWYRWSYASFPFSNKNGFIDLPCAFPKPLEGLVCLHSLHLELQQACRKEGLYSFWQCGLSWSTTWHVSYFWLMWWAVSWACFSEEARLFSGHRPKYVWDLGKRSMSLHLLKLVTLRKAGTVWEPRWYLRLGNCPLMQPMLPIFSSYLDVFKMPSVIEGTRSLELLGAVAFPSSIRLCVNADNLARYQK